MMNCPVLVIFSLLISYAASQSNPYCSISTCDPNTNTLCLYSNTTWGSACASANKTLSAVSASDIQTILKTTNDFRTLVALGQEKRGNPGPQPAASNMRELAWDSELAVMAQTHAQQCVFKHDQCSDVSRFQVGQNIYMSMSSVASKSSNWVAAITAWYNEVKDMVPDYVASYPTSPTAVIGHYTQLVWADTSVVGCGITFYKNGATFNAFYVCNYGSAGNFIGLPVYKTGCAASNCPVGTSASAGLCKLKSSG